MTLDDKINNMTRQVMSEIGVMNRGYNPNRDQKTGRFTYGPSSKRSTGSGSGSGSDSAAPAAKTYSAAERAEVRRQAEEMVSRMQPDDAYLASKIDGIAKDLGLQAKKGPIKKAERMAEKAIEEDGGNVFGMKDVVRATVVIQDYAQVQDVVNRIGEDFEVVRIKELEAGGYRDIKVNVTMPNSGYTGEFIVITPEMYRAKSKPTVYDQSGHDLYNVIRSPETSSSYKRAALKKTETIYEQAERRYMERTEKGKKMTIDI